MAPENQPINFKQPQKNWFLSHKVLTSAILILLLVVVLGVIDYAKVVDETVENLEKSELSREIAGEDKDNNGVRDDVDKYINESYPNSQKMRMALLQLAKAYQGAIINYMDHDAAVKYVNNAINAVDCVYYIDGVQAPKIVSTLEGKMANTKARYKAYLTANNYPDRTFNNAFNLEENKAKCNFDPDKLPN